MVSVGFRHLLAGPGVWQFTVHSIGAEWRLVMRRWVRWRTEVRVLVCESACFRRLGRGTDARLLLAPHLDHLFDKGYITFSDVGNMIVSG